jgi:hypothetical protein
MGKVVKFIPRKADDEVWECSCGNQSFYIVDNEYVQCSECDVQFPIECTLVDLAEPSNDG